LRSMTSPTTVAPPARRWVLRGGPAPRDAVTALESALRLPRVLCELLVLRGHADPEDAKRHLRPRLERLGDPWELAGMSAAVERLDLALRRGERILVHGDYDVDGICGAALYTRVLRSLGGRVEPFVPHRLQDGYDLGESGIRAAQEAGATLILTADCGIVAHGAVEAAARAGIDVVVTDHHTPGPTLPPAIAVVNPNRADCPYPEKVLSGTGVAYKVCQALLSARGVDPAPLGYELDLVAIATIADLAPLVGENRILTHYGLRVLAVTEKPGLRALLRTAGLADVERLQSGHVSHILAPRINAVGRMGAASRGVELLLAEDAGEAEAIAWELEEQNRERRDVDRQTLAEATALLAADYDPERDYAVVLASEGWHPGVIGIVASRVVELVHRPTVLIALEAGGGRARGSARSIPGFDLYEAIRSCEEHLERYGGHRQAAGLEIRPERIDAFRMDLNEHARSVLTPEDLVPEVELDVEVRLPEVNAELFGLLRHFGPFGVGNPTPVFYARRVGVVGYPRIVGDGHLKLDLVQGGARLGAIGFGMADRLHTVNLARGPIDVAFQLQENRWNGRVEVQARLIDVRSSD